MEGLGLKDNPETILSCGAMLQYLHDTQMNSMNQINHLELYTTESFMVLDSATRRNLELTETMRDKQKKGSLLWVLDKTKTAMGARLLREYVEQPLTEKSAIEERYASIEALNNEYVTREELREYLNCIYDLERLMTRVTLGTANPRDMLAFKNSIQYLPDIKHYIGTLECERFKTIYEDLDDLRDIYQLLDETIVEEPPIAIKEGGIFNR